MRKKSDIASGSSGILLLLTGLALYAIAVNRLIGHGDYATSITICLLGINSCFLGYVLSVSNSGFFPLQMDGKNRTNTQPPLTDPKLPKHPALPEKTSLENPPSQTGLQVKEASKPIDSPDRIATSFTIKGKGPQDWIVTGASVTGLGHLDNSIPCQDFCYAEPWNEENSIGCCIVCDGAGSQQLSHRAAKSVASQILPRALKENISKGHIDLSSEQFQPLSWETLALSAVKQTNVNLRYLATQHKLDFTEMGCTIIAIVYSPIGAYLVHIGDGRAAFHLKSEDRWEAMMTPWNGEHDNETVFLNSNIFGDNIRDFVECRTIHGEVDGLALLSDGAEKSVFVCKDRVDGRFENTNRPFEGFFGNVRDKILETKEPHRALAKYLTNGNPHLTSESDDRTLVVALRKNK